MPPPTRSHCYRSYVLDALDELLAECVIRGGRAALGVNQRDALVAIHRLRLTTALCHRRRWSRLPQRFHSGKKRVLTMTSTVKAEILGRVLIWDNWDTPFLSQITTVPISPTSDEMQDPTLPIQSLTSERRAEHDTIPCAS